jgi:hypothetical protein
MEELLKTPTTPYDIFEIAGKKCNVFTYPEIVKFTKYKQLFRKGNSDIPIINDKFKDYPFDDKFCIILYLTGERVGHWTCLSLNQDGINFLDSYGDVIDDQLQFVDSSIIGQNKKYLIKILAKSKLPLYYNDIQLQKYSNDIATCGKYCALYLKFNYMLIDDFMKVLIKNSKRLKMTPDELVCLLSA